MVYLDNAATSVPKSPYLKEVMDEYLNIGAYNISRSSYKGAYKLEEYIFDTRERVREFFHAKSDTTVAFSSGVTQSLNLFINGFFKKGDDVLISPFEHNAVMRPLEALSKRFDGCLSYTILPYIKDRALKEEDVKPLIKKNTRAIIINHTSNVSGRVEDIEFYSGIAKKYNLILVVDAAQGAGSSEIYFDRHSIDFLAFTNHKGLLALQGGGGALISSRLCGQLEPLIYGGTGSNSDSFIMPSSLPDKFEAGTQNILGIISLSAGLRFLCEVGVKKVGEHKNRCCSLFLEALGSLPSYEVVGRDTKNEYSGLVSIRHRTKDIGLLAASLDRDFDIATRVGLHCAPLAHKSLGTLESGGTIRFSFSYFTKDEEIEAALKALKALM